MLTHDLGRSVFGNPANKGKLISREEAMALLTDWVPNERLQLHMKQVGGLMGAWAREKEGASEQTAWAWELAGLLHDADWEKYPEQHCKKIIEELENRNVDPDVLHCIASHGPRYFGVEPVSSMDKMIYAFDELSGLIHAAALIRPDKYTGLELKSVLKRLKTPSFAAQVSRDDINDAVSRIDLSLEELIRFILDHQPAMS
ncbi:MAG: hydrolase [Chitinophagaceae bacterium]|nr:MAG: hydrolase [Chitinophagaceae bacterium]